MKDQDILISHRLNTLLKEISLVLPGSKRGIITLDTHNHVDFSLNHVSMTAGLTTSKRNSSDNSDSTRRIRPRIIVPKRPDCLLLAGSAARRLF